MPGVHHEHITSAHSVDGFHLELVGFGGNLIHSLRACGKNAAADSLYGCQGGYGCA